ncbi:hypothetical protein BDZ89DRAFT_386458 [Hymenopellis radicata]|nr:hypothetical protein BDZ89DRAFT_386458 [Hymenopellis radicata]
MKMALSSRPNWERSCALSARILQKSQDMINEVRKWHYRLPGVPLNDDEAGARSRPPGGDPAGVYGL